MVGHNAAKMAVGLGAHVIIIEKILNRLRELDDIYSSQSCHVGLEYLYDT